MKSLFVKLFIWFWLASTIAGLISFILAVTMAPGPAKGERVEALTLALQLYGRAAAANHEQGREILQLYPAEAPKEQWQTYLFTADGTPLLPATPEKLRRQVRQFATSGPEVTPPTERKRILAVRVQSPAGKEYIAAMNLPPSADHPRFRNFPFPPDMWFRVIVSIIIGGVACYTLAWWIAAPIRQLRVIAKKLAEGDLSARVELKMVGGSNDEMTELALEFNQMAERIENLLTSQKQLVRDVSHELRSPLARLNVALGLARREDGATTQAALDRIELESERLNFLIGDLLILSLLEGGGDTPATTSVHLCDLATEVAADADFEAASVNRQVRLVSCEPTTILGNRELLRRALENIVRNGIRYTKEGSAVEVSLGITPAGEALLKVRDHGPGVPDSALSDIFRPFYRVAADRDRHSGGAGIGLAIAERTVRLSGGTILARNVPGGGLEIEMQLPLA